MDSMSKTKFSYSLYLHENRTMYILQRSNKSINKFCSIVLNEQEMGDYITHSKINVF